MKIKDLFLQNQNFYFGINQPYGSTDWKGCRAVVRKNYQDKLVVEYEPYDEEGSNYKDGEISLSLQDMQSLNNSVALLNAFLETEIIEEN